MQSIVFFIALSAVVLLAKIFSNLHSDNKLSQKKIANLENENSILRDNLRSIEDNEYKIQILQHDVVELEEKNFNLQDNLDAANTEISRLKKEIEKLSIDIF